MTYLFIKVVFIMLDNKTAPYGVLVLRVLLGLSFLAHVRVKLFVYTVPGFVDYFVSLGLPPILAYPTILLELLGGLALVFGIYARWVAVPPGRSSTCGTSNVVTSTALTK